MKLKSWMESGSPVIENGRIEIEEEEDTWNVSDGERIRDGQEGAIMTYEQRPVVDVVHRVPHAHKQITEQLSQMLDKNR